MSIAESPTVGDKAAPPQAYRETPVLRTIGTCCGRLSQENGGAG